MARRRRVRRDRGTTYAWSAINRRRHDCPRLSTSRFPTVHIRNFGFFPIAKRNRVGISHRTDRPNRLDGPRRQAMVQFFFRTGQSSNERLEQIYDWSCHGAAERGDDEDGDTQRYRTRRCKTVLTFNRFCCGASPFSPLNIDIDDLSLETWTTRTRSPPSLPRQSLP